MVQSATYPAEAHELEAINGHHLDRTMVPARDKDVVARQFAQVFGLVHGSAPGSAEDGKLNDRGGGRGIYCKTSDGHLRELMTVPQMRTIVTEADIRSGVKALRRKCATMRHVHDTAGDPPLRRRAAGFEGLARIVVGQQLSIASAATIWERTAFACQPFEPITLLRLTEKELAAAGLSKPKIRTLRAVATACTNGLDLAALEKASAADIHGALTELVGIGPWTADIYIMFCLGRADAWAPGDLALQLALQRALALPERPGKEDMLELAERWRPWRGVAARLLWAYYAAVKAKSTAVPV